MKFLDQLLLFAWACIGVVIAMAVLVSIGPAVLGRVLTAENFAYVTPFPFLLLSTVRFLIHYDDEESSWVATMVISYLCGLLFLSTFTKTATLGWGRDALLSFILACFIAVVSVPLKYALKKITGKRRK